MLFKWMREHGRSGQKTKIVHNESGDGLLCKNCVGETSGNSGIAMNQHSKRDRETTKEPNRENKFLPL